jgi:hypothetical protein
MVIVTDFLTGVVTAIAIWGLVRKRFETPASLPDIRPAEAS